MGRKDKCAVCESVVAKTSSAVRCSRCNGWVHQACAGLEDEALEFMKRRIRGFAGFAKNALTIPRRCSEQLRLQQMCRRI